MGGGGVFIGLLLTLASFSNANGGRAFIFYGMIAIGCIGLLRGLTQLRAIDELPPVPPVEHPLEDDAD